MWWPRRKDGSTLELLYRLIDVDLGCDRIAPDKYHAWFSLGGFSDLRARDMVAKHLDKSSENIPGLWPFLSWCRSIEAVRWVKRRIREQPIFNSHLKNKRPEAQKVVRINLFDACDVVG